MSEFGSGLLYSVGLFLKHAERGYGADKLIAAYPSENEYWAMWWYGAADHLMDMRIPESLPDSIKGPAKLLEVIAIQYRLPMNEKPTDNKEKAAEAIALAVKILFEADKFIGVEPEKGDWE